MSESSIEAMRKKYNEQGELLIATIKKSKDLEVHKENYAAMAAALQNMALYLHGEGYGSKWSTGGILSHASTFEILKLSPDEFEVCGFFWIGKPNNVPLTPKRPPAQEFFKELD